MSYDPQPSNDPHLPKFGGEVYYVSKNGNDANSGTYPNNSMLSGVETRHQAFFIIT